jgi:hypothetical protein
MDTLSEILPLELSLLLPLLSEFLHFSHFLKLFVILKSHKARHTGICIVQQIAMMMGCVVLPHL